MKFIMIAQAAIQYNQKDYIFKITDISPSMDK